MYLTHYHLRARKHNQNFGFGFVGQFFGFVVSDKTKSGPKFCRFVVSDKTTSWLRRCVSTFRRETDDLQGPETSLTLQALRASLVLQGQKETRPT